MTINIRKYIFSRLKKLLNFNWINDKVLMFLRQIKIILNIDANAKSFL